MQRELYTIGYEGVGVEEFVAALQAAGIETLIDVRDVPVSRKRGFSKSALAAILEAHGIDYVHLKGLGDPKAGREAARAGEYGLFRRIFGSHMTTDVARRDLERAVALVCESPSCLMCFEHKHTNCHRSIVADHIAQRTGQVLQHISKRDLASAYERRSGNPGFAPA